MQKWQAEQQAGKNHKDDAHGLEMEALSNGRNQKHCGQENRDTHVLVDGLARSCTLIGYLCSLVTQTKKLLVLRVVVPRDEDRARRRFWFVERIGAQPGDKCRAVLVAKATLENSNEQVTARVNSKAQVFCRRVMVASSSRPTIQWSI